MCLIVDANVAAQVFNPNPSPDFAPVWRAIRDGRAVAVHGGQLTDEYAKLATVLVLVLELERQGRVRKVADDPVRAATRVFEQDNRRRSDDPHILGLAQAANVRLLCSHDQDLHEDFKNPALLQPAGSVYQSASHRHLIRRHCQHTRRRRRPRRANPG